jgi:diacylglycerol O-acyltransferase
MQASAKMKKTMSNVRSVMPTEFPSLGVPWMMSALVSLYGRSRLADRLPPIANVVVSNVPGARMPLYLAGARMTTNFPVSIVTHGLALNVTVQSYNGALDFGMIACRRAMPDVRLFAECMHAAHAELMAAAVPAVEPEAVPVKKRRAPVKPRVVTPAPVKSKLDLAPVAAKPKAPPAKRKPRVAEPA